MAIMLDALGADEDDLRPQVALRLAELVDRADGPASVLMTVKLLLEIMDGIKREVDGGVDEAFDDLVTEELARLQASRVDP